MTTREEVVNHIAHRLSIMDLDHIDTAEARAESMVRSIEDEAITKAYSELIDALNARIESAPKYQSEDWQNGIMFVANSIFEIAEAATTSHAVTLQSIRSEISTGEFNGEADDIDRA